MRKKKKFVFHIKPYHTDPTSHLSSVLVDYSSQPTMAFEIESEVLLNLVAVFVCITFAALMAGLTMGLLSLDPLDLLIKIRTSDPATSAQAQAVLPIVTNHHRLLVTLLLINAGANEALPLFLDELVPSYMAIILSVTLVLFCGEIIPSAIFTGPNQLRIAAKLAPLTRLLMFTTAPISYPIAKVLDKMLGHAESSNYSRREIMALVQVIDRASERAASTFLCEGVVQGLSRSGSSASSQLASLA